jgi:dTDP-4-amino-4,6-dideoxygalactose transaminase
MAVPFLTLGPSICEIREELDAAYDRVLASGQFILGPELSVFEADFAALAGTAHAVGTGNGCESLTLILRGLDIGPGDEVIVPCHTFIGTWLPVSEVGATPVPVDVDPETYNLTAAKLAPAISDRTRAIIAVHLYGQPCDCDPIVELCKEHGVWLLEDAAQAHGALYRGRPVGSIGFAAAFSFYPTKGLGAFGDGGAVTTDDADLARRVRRLRNYGSEETYRFEERGLNSRLDELQAAFLSEKLKRLRNWNESRRRVAARYGRNLAGLPVICPAVPQWAEAVWHQYVIRTEARDELQRHLADAGIGTGIHYPIPPHLQRAYTAEDLITHDVSVSEALARELLSLPIWPQITDGEIDEVCASIKDFFS